VWHLLRSVQPHHELYDSIFHGDELNPAKVTIKLGIGSGGQMHRRETQEDFPDDITFIDDEGGESNYATNANSDPLHDLEDALCFGGALYNSGDGKGMGKEKEKEKQRDVQFVDVAEGTVVDGVEVHSESLDSVEVLTARVLELEANEKRLQKTLQAFLQKGRD